MSVLFDEKISFVIPCYYSEKTVSGVVEEIFKAFPEEKYNIEIILVNDGSKDRTFQVISELAMKYKNVIAVNLAKNFGQDGARMAGYSFCSGEYVISLDDDGQNPPAEAHKLLEKINQGYDAVFGKYYIKKHSRFKNFGSKVNDKMANIMLGKPKDLSLCSYFVMNRFTVNQVLKYHGAFPYIWGLILRSTDNVSNEYIEHQAREVGETTYTFKKLLALWLNGFTSFSVKPLRVSTLVGSGVALIGFCFALYVAIISIVSGITVSGWASLICIMLLLCGLQLMMMGMLGEYVGRIFMSENNAPQYTVKEVITKKEDN